MYEDILRDIRKRCRLGMNGITSTSMREKGLNYKLNFGLSIPQIKEMATRYQPDKGLAEALWKEETRELKILATLLYPVNVCTKETANQWASEIPNQEIREQLCINLLQNLPFAKELAKEWSNSAKENIRTNGYWLLARLLLSKKYTGKISATEFPAIWEDIFAEDTFLRNASALMLKHIARYSKEEAYSILNKLAPYKEDADLLKQEAYHSIAFEVEFLYQ